MIVPDQLADFRDDFVHGFVRVAPRDFAREPLPEPFERIVLRAVRGKRLECPPWHVRDKRRHCLAPMDAAILQDPHQELSGTVLMQLMEQGDTGPRIPLGRLLPIHPWTLKVSRTKAGRTLTTRRLMPFARALPPLPASGDLGLVPPGRCIDKQHGYILRITLRCDGGDDRVHPRVFSWALGAWVGIVLAKRFYTHPPRFRARCTVLSLAWRPWWLKSATNRLVLQPASREPSALGGFANTGGSMGRAASSVRLVRPAGGVSLSPAIPSFRYPVSHLRIVWAWRPRDSAMVGTLWPRAASRTATQRSARCAVRMRRALSRAARCSGIRAIGIISSLSQR